MVAQSHGLRCQLAIIKIASRCNLNCSYCYMYNLADKTYKTKPSLMSDITIDAIIAKVALHCLQHEQRQILFAFHGGEPLLAGIPRLRRFVEKVRARLPTSTEPIFSLQTNGTLLTSEWCNFFRESDIHLGISLDGPKIIHDQRRVDHFGNGSYDEVMIGWRMATSHGLNPSALTVIDLDCTAQSMFDYVRELSPSKIDFLLPDGTYDNPPPRKGRADGWESPYGDWLCEFFEIWTRAGAPFRVVTFERIARMVLGMFDTYDAFGEGRNEVLVFETDGSIEPIDVLKSCKDKLTQTEYSVHNHTIDEALTHPLIQQYALSNEAIPEDCRGCTLNRLCAGGYFPHRFSEEHYFALPSVYCGDLMKIITTVQSHVVGNLPSDVCKDAGLVPLTLKRVRESLVQSRMESMLCAQARDMQQLTAG